MLAAGRETDQTCPATGFELIIRPEEADLGPDPGPGPDFEATLALAVVPRT